jgi:hypothetical protein
MCPTGRYDHNGEFYLDIPWHLVGSPLVSVFLLVLERNLPDGVTECDSPTHVSTVWADWRYGQRVEMIARLFWPSMIVTADSNLHYGRERDDQFALLSRARKAIVEAEAALRCGLAVAS